MSIVRGAYPERAWADDRFQAGYEVVFGSRRRASVVAALNRLESRKNSREPGWNAEFCRRVRERVDIPVLLEGGVRSRDQIDGLLGTRTGQEQACDLVGMARPFYAEPRLPARLLDVTDPTVRVACESCNNCTVPQVTGADGVCRTPTVLAKRGRFERAGAYEREHHGPPR